MTDWDTVKEEAEEFGEHLDDLQERVEQQAVDIKRLKRELKKFREELEADDGAISSEKDTA